MNKLVLKSAAVLAATLIVSPIIASTVSAATYNSESNVTFEAGSPTTPPVDPTKPTDPKPDPEPDPEPGTPGPLSIDFASSLEFGTQAIATSDKTYYAHAQQYVNGDQRPDFVQVTDTRGTLKGWTLSVKTSSQFYTVIDPTVVAEAAAAPGDYLSGAAISFSAGQVQGNGVATAPSTVASTLTLSNSDQTIVTAGENEGVGTWIYRLGASEADYDTAATAAADVATKGPITLTVPGTTVKKAAAYTTDLIWTLAETPTN